MLEVPTLHSPPRPTRSSSSCRRASDDEQQQQLGFQHAGGGFPTSADDCCGVDFVGMVVDDDAADSLLLDYIDFSSCDVVPFFDADGDVLPDLEADPTELLLADFSSLPSPAAAPPPDNDDKQEDLDDLLADGMQQVKEMSSGCHDDAATTTNDSIIKNNNNSKQEEPLAGGGSSAATSTTADQEEEDSVSAGGPAGAASDASKSTSSAEGRHRHGKKKGAAAAAAAGSNPHGKRKVKVDWTPELHRRFVQAVEQLGIDKAVPSRILEIMGIKCLTRHNIASHLQKYRSHRKHLMAREAEAASWAQKRQMYAAGGAAAPRTKLVVDHPSAAAAARPWLVPTIGFPPPPPAPFCRPLHVWGHPPSTAAPEAAASPAPATTMLLPLPVWPRHLAPPPRPTTPWAVDPAAYWQQQQQQHYSAARKWGAAAAVTPGTPVQLPRFPVPHHPIPMYRPPATMVPAVVVVPPPQQQQQSSSKLAELQLQLDAHPSKESIDAAIGDVLVKPWLPLPLGLKPPSLDSVMSELHKHGIPKVPPGGDRLISF